MKKACCGRAPPRRGQEGEDITSTSHNFRYFRAAERQAAAVLEVRGEVYMTHKAFAAEQASRKRTAKPTYANPRIPPPVRCASSILPLPPRR